MTIFGIELNWLPVLTFIAGLVIGSAMYETRTINLRQQNIRNGYAMVGTAKRRRFTIASITIKWAKETYKKI